MSVDGELLAGPLAIILEGLSLPYDQEESKVKNCYGLLGLDRTVFLPVPFFSFRPSGHIQNLLPPGFIP
jgi:hypothetical protein